MGVFVFNQCFEAMLFNFVHLDLPCYHSFRVQLPLVEKSISAVRVRFISS